MKDILEHYIRSLSEREDHSSLAQDLGALLVWLLEYLGYHIHYYPYVFKSPDVQRVSGRGERQFGVDLLASKTIDGQRTLFRFVLKHGNISPDDWNAARQGSLPGDIGHAANLPINADEQFTGQDEQNSKVVVVGVFNGDLKRDTIGHLINALEKRIEITCGADIKIQWWDARELVRLLEGVLERNGLDSAFFAPETRPFVRMVLDSIRRDSNAQGATFDYDSLERLFDAQKRAIERKHYKDSYLRKDYITQGLSELALVSFMLQRQCELHASGNILPVLVMLERSLLFAATLVQQMSPHSSGTKKGVVESIRSLLRRHVSATLVLAERLKHVAPIEDGLALAGHAEQVDYSLRSYWLGAFLATGLIAARELNDETSYVEIYDTLQLLIEQNPVGFGHLVFDDQVIELLVILYSLEHKQRCDLVFEAIQRYGLRLDYEKNLPFGSLLTGYPIQQIDLDRVLEEMEEDDTPPGEIPYSQRATTLLVVLIYAAHTFKFEKLDKMCGSFLGAHRQHPLFLQIWQPPESMPKRLYSEYLVEDGATHILETTQGYEHFIQNLESNLTPQPETIMQQMGFHVVDCMAWKRYRTLPHMGWVKWMLKHPPRTRVDESE